MLNQIPFRFLAAYREVVETAKKREINLMSLALAPYEVCLPLNASVKKHQSVMNGLKRLEDYGGNAKSSLLQSFERGKLQKSILSKALWRSLLNH